MGFYRFEYAPAHSPALRRLFFKGSKGLGRCSIGHIVWAGPPSRAKGLPVNIISE